MNDKHMSYRRGLLTRETSANTNPRPRVKRKQITQSEIGAHQVTRNANAPPFMCVWHRQTPEECIKSSSSCEQEMDSQRQEVTLWRKEVFASIRPLSAGRGGRPRGGAGGFNQRVDLQKGKRGQQCGSGCEGDLDDTWSDKNKQKKKYSSSPRYVHPTYEHS